MIVVPPSSLRTPSYRLHKPTGQAVVTLNGKDRYLGVHGTEASRGMYDRLIAEWLANGRKLAAVDDAQDIAVVEVIAAFRERAKGYYVRPDGAPTGEADNYRLALRPLKKLFAALPAMQFGPRALEQVRDEMVRMEWTRKNVNRQVNRIKSVFKWAVARELVPASVYAALECVAGLRRGQGRVAEAERVMPVDERHVTATLPHLSKPVAAMVQLQLLTGARPGEIVRMRAADLDMTSDAEKNPTCPVWLYRPTDHKTAHLDLERVISIGPRAQKVIRPFLQGRPVTAYLFSPAEADADRRAVLQDARKTPASCGNVPGSNRQDDPKRKPGGRYNVSSYRRAIPRACEKADRLAHEQNPSVPADQAIVARWHPHQLRHNAATEVEKKYGLEHAQAVLGHMSPAITTNYANQRHVRARDVMREVG